MHSESSYTDQAAAAILQAARTEHDFAGWLAGVLAQTASELGASDALTARRPGSWEAELVQNLVKGTVGWEDECLADYARASPGSGIPGEHS